MNLINDLNWRYATKSYTSEKVNEEKLNFILEATRLTASSIGLQPYRVIVIDNKELKARLGENSFNKQISNSSHLLVFASYNNVSTRHVEDLVTLTANKQGVSMESLNGLLTAASTYISSRSDEENKLWAERQTYIALGTAMVAAANIKVDATPMEGFDSALFDEVLGLKEKNLHSVVLLSLGYRDEAVDFLAKRPKARIAMEEFVMKVS